MGSRGVRHEEISFTKADVARLAARLLDIGPKDVVADLCCGIGSFMVQVFRETVPKAFHGADFGYETLMVSMMRAAVIDGPIEIRLCNVFDTTDTFDRVFVDAPWGIRLKDKPELNGKGMEDLAGLARARQVTSEWLFALKALESLTEDGRAVVTMPMGALGGTAGAALRRQLVLSGRVRAVVALPRGVMPGTGAACALLVLGREREPETVAFVDASDLGHGRQSVGLADEAIAEVVRRVSGDTDAHACVATVTEIETEGFSLTPIRYTERIEAENMATLGSLATNIMRGVGHIRLDERSVAEDTRIRYLEVRNLDEDGNVTDLTNLASIERREERYCVADGDVILSKSLPFRTAVVRVEPDERILCSGNFYIIRPDRTQIDPIYLKLFLDSQLGQTQLRRISSGSSVLTIPVHDLQNILVPLVPLEEQKKIAAAYESLAGELSLYRRRIERTRERIGELFLARGRA